MRVGQNPERSQRAPLEFQPVAMAVVTHLPHLTMAYHEKRVEVVRTCLETMRAGARVEHTFMVWDNGSCPELRGWLQNEFKPDILILSRNIGKTAARTALFRMCPLETIVAYSDDDMLFCDDWLRPQIELLQHFPNVSSVTGYPVRSSFRWGNDNTKAWARENAQMEVGRFLPQEWEDDFAVSVGRDPQWHADYTKDDFDARATYNGKTAYLTSHHCQFIGYAKTVGRVLQYDNKAMADERPFDVGLDQIGLRLATTQRLTRHIGNVIHDELRKEIEWQAT